jgi:hypothetical protein
LRAVLFTDVTWRKIREALCNREDFDCSLNEEDASFHIIFESDKYQHPPTELVLTAQLGAYKRWLSPDPEWLKGSHVQLHKILVQELPGPDPTARKEIVEFMHKIGNIVHQCVPTKDPGVGTHLLIIKFEFPTGKDGWFQIRGSPDIEGLETQKVWDAVAKLEKTKPQTEVYIFFSMMFDIWGNTQQIS